MKTKALLVGARPSFVGPFVKLEKGVWLVEPPCPQVVVRFGDQMITERCEIEIPAPTRVQALVRKDYDGPDVHLDIKMIGELQ